MILKSLRYAGLAALALLAACQRDSGDGPTEISGKLFVFNYRVATATYMITLQRKAPLPENGVVEAEYENPQGGAPLTTRSKIFPFWEKIVLESPPLHCVVKDRRYAVKIRILDSDSKLLQSLETTVVSNLDQSILPAKPLVIGPIYTRNPDVYKADGTVDYSPETGCPT
ncbi:hypothetical protein [Metarhizobium album]|uniref:hypothetical protein n=1 Tax=Metarhizobium album TaxID=2182425 RepID=UPI0026C08774